MQNFIKALLCLTTMLVLLTDSGSVYAAVAGRVQFVHGTVQLTSATGVTHAIRKGEAVNEGDTLISAQTASAQIRMEDGGIVAMRADTKLKIDRFIFDGQQDGTERSFFTLFKGGFRAITGQIGKKNKINYKITTPASTIGIRGTDHETFVVTPDSPLAAAIGTYNKVNMGGTIMTTEKGAVSVLPNQMGFAGAADQMPQLQPINLNIFTVTGQPAAQAGGEKHEGKQEGGRDVRESTTMDRREVRETATVDKNEIRESAGSDRNRMEGGATLSPSREDAVNTMSTTTNTIPTENVPEQH